MISLNIGRSSRLQSRTKRMARRPRGHEKIYLDIKRFGYFPEQFTWRGRRFQVHAVERCWTVSRRRLGQRVERLCFRVRGAAPGRWSSDADGTILEGTFDLYQDLNTNTWHLEKIVSQG